MPFCTRCGEKIPEDDTFCQECGAALKRNSAVSPAPEDTASAAREAMATAAANVMASVAAAASALRNRMTHKVIGIAGSGIAVVVLVIVLVVVLTGSEHFSETVARSLVEKHLDTNRNYVDSRTCLSNFPYDKDPVAVNSADSNSQRWLGALVEEGIYDKPEQRNSGGYFPQIQLIYRKTGLGKKVTKGHQLCFAEGLDVLKVGNIQKNEKPGDSAVASADVTLGLRNSASWMKNPVAQEMFGDTFKREIQESFRFSLTKDKKWKIDGVGHTYTAPNQNQLSPFNGSAMPSQQVSSIELFDKLKEFFSFGNPLIGKWDGAVMGSLIEFEFTSDTMRSASGEVKVHYEVRDSEVVVYPEGQLTGMIFKKIDADTMQINMGLFSVDLKRFK